MLKNTRLQKAWLVLCWIKLKKRTLWLLIFCRKTTTTTNFRLYLCTLTVIFPALTPQIKKNVFRVQILRPIDMVSITNKFVKWQGDDNHLWRPSIAREQVRIIVELTKSKKLTAKSQALIRRTYPSYFCSSAETVTTIQDS